MNNQELAKQIIEENIYLNLATVSKDGVPLCTPLYCSYDDDYNFYWVSWAENQHSRNIRENPGVSACIYNSKADEGTGRGVYLEGGAVELSETTEIQHALKSHYERKSAAPRVPEEFRGEFPRRVYRFTPEKVWMNSTSDIKGNFIDVREEIEL